MQFQTIIIFLNNWTKLKIITIEKDVIDNPYRESFFTLSKNLELAKSTTN